MKAKVYTLKTLLPQWFWEKLQEPLRYILSNFIILPSSYTDTELCLYM